MEHLANLERLDLPEDATLLASGRSNGNGIVSGRLYLHTNDVKNSQANTIYCKSHLEPSDIGVIRASNGILTAHGGLTSHAAVVANSLGKPLVTRCAELRFCDQPHHVHFGDEIIEEGDMIRIRTPGGGGYGNPRDREHELIRKDLEAGFITEKSAKEDYGYQENMH